MKNNPESQAADSVIWDALKEKYKKYSVPPDTFRPKASRKHDHDNHHEGEKGSKRQKTTKGSSSINKEYLSVNVTSSSKTTIVRKPKTYASQPSRQEYDGWSTGQEINDDEDIFEEATTEFLAEIL
ncbi:hypothetical protein Tco_1495826, partial [Tanacetum coccineum]